MYVCICVYTIATSHALILHQYITTLLCPAVENLLSVAVKNYAEIEKRIAQGTKNRTLASTNMNATSR